MMIPLAKTGAMRYSVYIIKIIKKKEKAIYMLKCIIVLDEEKVTNEGLYDVNELKETLKNICLSEQLHEEEPNHYVLDEVRGSIGARMLLLGKMERSNILQNLKEWKDFDDADSDDGSFHETDMLALCRKEGLL